MLIRFEKRRILGKDLVFLGWESTATNTFPNIRYSPAKSCSVGETVNNRIKFGFRISGCFLNQSAATSRKILGDIRGFGFKRSQIPESLIKLPPEFEIIAMVFLLRILVHGMKLRNIGSCRKFEGFFRSGVYFLVSVLDRGLLFMRRISRYFRGR